MNKLHLFGAACACIITQIVSTPVLSVPIYPNEIQACISTTVCSNPTLVQQSSTFGAYLYLDEGIPKYLFEYLDLPSSESTNFSTTHLSGSVWVSANATYDLTQERHFFNLYLDGVTPTPTNLWVFDSDGLDVGLSMPTPDLLAGTSFFRLWEDQGAGGFFLEGELGTLGDLGQGMYPLADNHSFVPCLADTCEVGAKLNLLYLQYSQVGSTAVLSINEADQRGLLYSQYRSFQDNTLSQSYGIVPIPPAIWLFGSGLIGLIGIARRKRA